MPEYLKIRQEQEDRRPPVTIGMALTECCLVTLFILSIIVMIVLRLT